MEAVHEDAPEEKNNDPPDNLDKLKVAELRAILSEQGMDAKGKKSELIERIRSA